MLKKEEFCFGSIKDAYISHLVATVSPTVLRSEEKLLDVWTVGKKKISTNKSIYPSMLNRGK